jgi:PPP family 3-phenylpropionic acid transporter
VRGRFGALHAASFIGLGAALPFFPVWLEARGLEAPEIGLILALPPLIRILAAAPLMSLIDRGVETRALLVAADLALALAYAALVFAHDPWLIGAIVAVSAIANAPIVPATDYVTLQAIRNDPRLDYGRVRLWGSIAFLGANIGSGYVFRFLPVDALVALLAGVATGAMAVAWLAIPAAPPLKRPAETPQTRVTRLPPRLWLVIGAAALTQASHAAVYGFASLHWRDLGYASTTIGYLWAIGVVAEIAVFWAFGRQVGRASVALGFLGLGAGAGVVRFAAMSLDPSLGLAFALQALHGLSFGATHLGTMAALALLAPEAARGRAQGVLSSTQALAMAGATALSGLVFRAAGPLVFLAMVPLAASGLALALVALRSGRPQPQSERGGGRTTLPS